MDVVEAYQPERCMRQLSFVRMIPRTMPHRGKFHRPAKALGYRVDYGDYAVHPWESWPNHRVVLSSLSRLSLSPRDVDPNYLPWFLSISHHFIINPSTLDRPDKYHLTAEMGHTALLRLAGVYQPGPSRQAYLDCMTDDMELIMRSWMDDTGYCVGSDDGRGRGRGRGR
ncbi:hypothetical protein RND81_04G015500 [Saponaria officinalis]|uniref:Uncharacterized protein n=1 Tax=Saponaria officinalis TaxID=3572 RepID=A0AAW1LC90_SAPOF